jgi:nucleoid DNA-binding protein
MTRKTPPAPSAKRVNSQGVAKGVALAVQRPTAVGHAMLARVLEEIAANLVVVGDTVALRGFGTFTVRLRPARRYRNPSTGGFVTRPAVSYIHFKPSPHAPR